MNSKTRNLLLVTLFGGILLALIAGAYLKPYSREEMSYAGFRSALKAGEIRRVTIAGEDIIGTKHDGSRFVTFNPGDPALIKDLIDLGIEFKGVSPEKFMFWFGFVSKSLLLGLFIFLIQKRVGPLFGFGKTKLVCIEDDKDRITFVDVAGCDEAKNEVREIVDILKDPQKFDRLGGKMPRGALMMGPPGTGKTLLARAIAGEARVPFFSMSGSDFVEMYAGLGAARVRSLFAAARKKAPCIIFIDEIDSLGRHRGSGETEGHNEREQTLNQLLVAMDGFKGNEGIILIAATNRPDVLDKALLRPGRFDRMISVGLPDVQGRMAILEVHAKKVPLSANVTLGRIARGTPGFSGADLANLVNEAALAAARMNQEVVEQADFEKAREKILMGAERNSSVMSESERLVTAYHEAGHALVGLLMPDHDPIYKISIIPRGRTLGVTLFLPERDQVSVSREKLEGQIASLYGGRLAEEIIFGSGKVTTGAQNDIERATQIAENMVTQWGFSEKIGPMSFREETGPYGASGRCSKSGSEETAQLIDQEIRQLIARNYSRAEQLIRDNIDTLHQLAEALMTHETLDRSHINHIIKS